MSELCFYLSRDASTRRRAASTTERDARDVDARVRDGGGRADAATLETLNAHVGRQVWTHVDANEGDDEAGETTTTTTTTTGRGKRRATTVDEGRDKEGTRGARRDAGGVREDAERA